MKIQGSIEINAPRNKVIEYFSNPEYLKEYQDGFVSKELISGNFGQNGAVSKMLYQTGKRKMTLVETIINNDFPESFDAHYHHKFMDNTMKCYFQELDSSTTKYSYEVEYTRINWFLPKLMALLFPSIYRKQIEKWVRQFKHFVENQMQIQN